MDNTFSYINSYDEYFETKLNVETPSFCPYCDHDVNFHIKNCYHNNIKATFTFFLQCPNCDNYSIWKTNSYYETISFIPHAIKIEKAPKSIAEISPDFIAAYEESQMADSVHLHIICGIGYRKALEFLVKDYMIYLSPNDKENIANEPLMQTIKRIPLPQIQTLAEKTAWLGNDEAHFVRKHKDLDLADLKRFLEATIKYIDLELTVAEAEQIQKQ